MTLVKAMLQQGEAGCAGVMWRIVGVAAGNSTVVGDLSASLVSCRGLRLVVGVNAPPRERLRAIWIKRVPDMDGLNAA